MGKFYYTVGANIETSYITFIKTHKLMTISAEQVRAAIKPDAVAKLKLFDDETSARAYANSIQEVNPNYSQFPMMYPAVYKVYALDVPVGSEVKQIEVKNVKMKKYNFLHRDDIKTITYLEIDNDENNILVFNGHHLYKNDNPDIFIDENYYKRICVQHSDFIEGIKALFDDYAAPAVGFIPKALLNYHFVSEAQQLAKEIHNIARNNSSPLAEIYQRLKERHQQLIQDPDVNRTGSFVTLIEYVMKRINANVYADSITFENNNNNNSQSSSYQLRN